MSGKIVKIVLSFVSSQTVPLDCHDKHLDDDIDRDDFTIINASEVYKKA